MTANDPSVVDELSERSYFDRDYSITSRRRLLVTLASGGPVLLAGCGGKGSTTPTGTTRSQHTTPANDSTDNLQHVRGQTFRAPTRQDPAKTAFYRGGPTLQQTAYAAVAKEPATYSLRVFLRPPGVWSNGQFVNPLGLDGSPPLLYNWLENIDITPTEITVMIRADASWSDGNPITGTDIAVPPIERTLLKYFLPPPRYAPEPEGPSRWDRPDEPQRVLAAFDDFEINEKSVTYRSSGGHFDQFYEKTIGLWFGPVFPPLSPTHIGPFDAHADAVIETARRAQAGEIYPWHGQAYDDPNKQSLVEEHLADPKYVRKFADPDNVHAIGAWDLVAIDGKEFVFEPNSHHRQAETINFDTVRFEYTRGTQRLRTAVKSDRLDFGRLGTTPKTVVESFPDNLEIIRVPGGVHTGNELAMNFAHPALGTREVRLAIMYALDQSTIAKNIHQSVAVPVTTPGGDCWRATLYVNQDTIDETFTTYKQDRKRAATLMQKAGYSRDDGQWVNADGKPFTLLLPTPSSPPKWEPAVASQLSEFGIDTTVQTLDGTVFTSRRDEGKFAIWPASGTATADGLATLGIWAAAAKNPDRFGIYPANQFETGKFSDSGAPLPHTEERWRVFTIRAPPVGKPNGQLKEYHPAALALLDETNPPPQEFRRRIKIGMWLANWYLPTIPINKRYVQHFIDDAHWVWPTDTVMWKNFTEGTSLSPKALLGDLDVRANPDNPEKGATVGEK